MIKFATFFLSASLLEKIYVESKSVSKEAL